MEEHQLSTSHSAVEKKPPLSENCSLEDEPPAKRQLYVEAVRGMWNLVKVYRQLGTREQAIAFAEERGMILREKVCNYHKKPMSVDYSTNKTVGSFICHRGPCRAKSKVSRGKGTWFENIKIQMPQVFYLMYAYLEKYSYERTIKEEFTEGEHRLSSSTINDWFHRCREAVVAYQINKQTVTGKIGGSGKVVQIGESKFRNRKYNKGCQDESHWILGMIEDGSEDLRLEVCPDNVHSAEVLVPLIKKHVANGTTIHTDFWPANNCLGDHGFIHHNVNRNNLDNTFASKDGFNIQRINSQWRFVKRFIYTTNYNSHANIDDLIYEYLWRKDVKRSQRDPFEELIKVINYRFNK